MIIVNGAPKSGTHAVMAMLARMGLKRRPGTLLEAPGGLHAAGCSLDALLAEPAPGIFVHAHVSASQQLPGLVLTVFRDPRNMLVSYCRHRERVDGHRPTVAEAIGDFWGVPFVPLYASYLGWHGRSVVLRYENLPPEQVGAGEALYAGEPRDWNTRTGTPSNWRTAWTAKADRAWREAGGPELLRWAGYEEDPC